MKSQVSRLGYVRLEVQKDGRPINAHVHRLVLLAFRGECPDGMEACHNNGIRSDNRIMNLRWDTHSGNAADMVRHGTQVILRGSACPTSKLDEPAVVLIRRRMERGEKYQRIAKELGLSPETIRKIRIRKTWAHVN